MIKRVILAVIAMVPLLSLNAAADLMWSAAETQQYVNIHSEPNDSSEVIATLDYNAVIEVESIDENGWAKTSAGYISTVYLTTEEPVEAAYRTATFEEGSYVRAEANPEAEIITTIYDTSMEVEVIGTEGEYYKVLFEDGTLGYTSDTITSVENNYATSKDFTYYEESTVVEEYNYYVEPDYSGENDWGLEYNPEFDYIEEENYEDPYEEIYSNYYMEEENQAVNLEEDYYSEEDYIDYYYAKEEYIDDYEIEEYYEEVYEEYVDEEITYEETYSDSSIGELIAATALNYLGTPYVYGGTSLSSGSDCSGFTQAVCGLCGISIPRTAEAQSSGGTSVDISNIQTGDLVYYGGHIGIYIGGGQIIHNSNSNTGVITSSLYYKTPLNVVRYW